MHIMIDITNLEKVTIKDVKALIDREGTEIIEIAVPKSSQQFFSDPTSIAWDYAFAAYSAQELAKVGTITAHEFPEPTELESYFFTVRIADKNAFAETVYALSCLYCFTENEEFADGQAFSYVDQFIYEVKNGEVIPVFPELIEVFEELLPEEDESENE